MPYVGNCLLWSWDKTGTHCLVADPGLGTWLVLGALLAVSLFIALRYGD